MQKKRQRKRQSGLRAAAGRPPEVSGFRGRLQDSWRTYLNLFLGVLLVILIGVPTVAYVVYRFADNEEGTPQQVQSVVSQPSAASAQLRSLVEQSRKQPENGLTWLKLGRAYAAGRDYRKAADAFEHARKLLDDNPVVLVDEADALAMEADGQMAGRPADLVNKALQKDPKLTKGLWLAGIAANQAGNYRQAQTYLQRLLPLLDPKSADANDIRQTLAQIRKKMAGATGTSD